MLTRRILETYPYPAAILNANGLVQRANSLAAEISPEGSVISDAFDAEEGEKLLGCLRSAARTSAPVMISAHINSDVSPDRAPISVTRVSGAGEPLSFLIAINTFSQHRFRRLTEKVEQLNRQMRQTLQENAILQKTLDDNRTLTRELFHMVRNNLQTMLSISRLGEREAGEKGVDPGKVAHQTHQRLQALASSQRTIRLGEEGHGSASELVQALRRTFSETFGPDLEITWTVKDFPLVTGQEQGLTLLINEICISLLRGFPEERPIKLQVQLERAAEGTGRLRVTRDGAPIRRSAIEMANGSARLVSALLVQIGETGRRADEIDFTFKIAVTEAAGEDDDGAGAD